MKRLRRLVFGWLLAFGWIMALSDSAAIAAPRPAAQGRIIYLDDTPDNNGSVSCPATSINTLADAVTAIGPFSRNVTLYMCSGEYQVPTPPQTLPSFTEHINLKIIGKGTPVIKARPGENPDIFYFNDSENVTVQGIVFNGQGHLNATSGSAIVFDNTSGSITGNTISGWHMAYSGPPPFDVGVPNMAQHSIHVLGDLSTPKKVQVLNNTIYDSQDTGIFVSNTTGVVKISKNRVVFGSAIIPGLRPGGTARFQAGIGLVNVGPGALITGNEIISDADLYPMPLTHTRGIMLFASSGVKVTGNVLRGNSVQISIENWCHRQDTNANSNVISGNKLYDTWNAGILIMARNDQTIPVQDCMATPHADSNQIKGNTIYALDFNAPDNTGGQFGVRLVTVGGVIANTVISGNTIAGFGIARSISLENPVDMPGTAQTKNTLLDAPPAGVYK